MSNRVRRIESRAFVERELTIGILGMLAAMLLSAGALCADTPNEAPLSTLVDRPSVGQFEGDLMLFFNKDADGRRRFRLPDYEHDFVWSRSLVFDASSPTGQPLPNNAMNIVVHNGKLYVGTAAAFEKSNYSQHRAYVFVKEDKDSPWKVDAEFEPRSERVGALYSARFEFDGNGLAIEGGPVSILLAGTNKGAGSPPRPMQIKIRDDRSGEWIAADISTKTVAAYRVREIISRRDRITGADMVFVGADPEPNGIYAGVYDATAPGLIRWNPVPELMAARGKFFGMAEANGHVFVSDRRGVFKRVDGESPRWVLMMKSTFEGGTWANDELRGLSAVPNPKEITGWPEEEMLIFGGGMAVYRMRAGCVGPEPKEEDLPRANYTVVKEVDLNSVLAEVLKHPVVFSEAAFNYVNPFNPPGADSPVWVIGFHFHYGVEGKEFVMKDLSTWTRNPYAFYLLRDVNGNHSLRIVEDPDNPDKVLYLMRDNVPSPFPGEENVVYAAGFNASYFKGSLGTAWVYKGEWK